jgi:hypothetical protein
MSIPNYILYLIAGILFSVIISPSIFNVIDTSFDCELMSSNNIEFCFIQKRIINFVLFVGPPGLGLLYGLKK